MERAAKAARALRVERPSVGDRARVEREHRPQRRPVAIERRQPPQVFAHDVLGRRLAARHRVLQLRHRLFNNGEAARSPFDKLRVSDLGARSCASFRRRVRPSTGTTRWHWSSSRTADTVVSSTGHDAGWPSASSPAPPDLGAHLRRRSPLQDGMKRTSDKIASGSGRASARPKYSIAIGSADCVLHGGEATVLPTLSATVREGFRASEPSVIHPCREATDSVVGVVVRCSRASTTERSIALRDPMCDVGTSAPLLQGAQPTAQTPALRARTPLLCP